MKKLVIEVFRVGEHTDSGGNTREWTLEDLQDIVNTYNTAVQNDSSLIAPLVKGHPEDDSPAYGWVQSLRLNGDIMEAEIEFSDEIVEEIKEQKFKKISIALFENMRLRHIGILGAMPPAVEGLKPVKFSKDKSYYFLFEDDDLPIDPTDKDDVKKRMELEVEISEREKKYGIKRKAGGHLVKLEIHKDLNEDQFADPVNYLFPINDEANIIASMNTFRDWDSRHKYDAEEQQYILARLIKAVEEYKIDTEKHRYYFSVGAGGVSFIGISLKEELKRDLPEGRKENEFADNVHFRFPIGTKTQIQSSAALVHKEKFMSHYTDDEKKLIRSRIIKSAIDAGIKLNDENWKFFQTREYYGVNIPIKELSKTQLEKILLKQMEPNNQVNNDNNNSINNKKEFSVMLEYINKLIAALVNWVSENVDPEVASNFQAFIGEWQKQNPAPSNDPPATPPAPDNGFGGMTERERAYAKRIEALERDKRNTEFSKNMDKLIEAGRMLPAQRESMIALMEAIHQNDSSLEFSVGEDKKKMNPLETLMFNLEKLPAHNLTKEDAKDGKNEPVGNPEDALHAKILEYQKEQADKGTIVSYNDAYVHVKKSKGE